LQMQMFRIPSYH